jgi:bacteriocin biosynthesis cyclodehydratase domain-containing protein
MTPGRPRLAFPFTVLTAQDTVRLVAGEDFRYTLSGAGIDEWLPGVLEGLDGRRTLDDLVRGLPADRVAAARGLVERLHAERVVVEGPAAPAHEAMRYDIRAEGSGRLLESLREGGDGARPAVAVLCQDRLDLDEALRFNRRSLAGDVPWLWATYGPMSRGYVSPPFLPGAGPCLGCLIRHFRRLSPAPEIHDGLIDHASRGRPFEPAPFPAAGVEILCQLVLWKVSLLGEAEPPAALYRLHVLDVHELEVASHRVFADPECPDCLAKPR